MSDKSNKETNNVNKMPAALSYGLLALKYGALVLVAGLAIKHFIS